MRLTSDDIQHSLMSQMHPIEIAYGRRSATVALRYEFGVADDSHALELALGVQACNCSRGISRTCGLARAQPLRP